MGKNPNPSWDPKTLPSGSLRRNLFFKSCFKGWEGTNVPRTPFLHLNQIQLPIPSKYPMQIAQVYRSLIGKKKYCKQTWLLSSLMVVFDLQRKNPARTSGNGMQVCRLTCKKKMMQPNCFWLYLVSPCETFCFLDTPYTHYIPGLSLESDPARQHRGKHIC